MPESMNLGALRRKVRLLKCKALYIRMLSRVDLVLVTDNNSIHIITTHKIYDHHIRGPSRNLTSVLWCRISKSIMNFELILSEHVYGYWIYLLA